MNHFFGQTLSPVPTMCCVKRALILEKLKELREKHYPTIPDFVKATKLHDANVRSIEAGDSMPSIERMETWTKACGVPLSEFISRIEAIERGGKPKTEHPLVERLKIVASTAPNVADALLLVLDGLSKNKQR